MRYKLILTFLILAFTGLYVAWDFVRVPPSLTLSSQGGQIEVNKEIIPNLSFTSIEGEAISLYDFKGKVVLVNFWATWCAPCIVEFPPLLELAHMKKDQIVLVALSVDEDPTKIEPFLKQHNLNIAPKNVIIAHDQNKAISQDIFQTVLYPETYIIGPDLTLQKKIVGLIDWTGDDILSFLETLNLGVRTH